MNNLPDLSPSELVQLSRMLAEQDETPTIHYAEPLESEDGVEQEHEASEDRPGPFDATPTAPAGGVLSLLTGEGSFKGHKFKMSDAKLGKVHELVAQTIAADLREEIKRIQNG